MGIFNVKSKHRWGVFSINCVFVVIFENCLPCKNLSSGSHFNFSLSQVYDYATDPDIVLKDVVSHHTILMCDIEMAIFATILIWLSALILLVFFILGFFLYIFMSLTSTAFFYLSLWVVIPCAVYYLSYKTSLFLAYL